MLWITVQNWRKSSEIYPTFEEIAKKDLDHFFEGVNQKNAKKGTFPKEKGPYEVSVKENTGGKKRKTLKNEFHDDFEDHAVEERLHVHVRLVGLDFGDDFARLDGVTDGLVPGHDDALFHGRAELNHFYDICHLALQSGRRQGARSCRAMRRGGQSR